MVWWLIKHRDNFTFYFNVDVYRSVQNLLSSRLLSKSIKIAIYETIILPVVLYGCKTWSLTLREEQGAEENIWTEERRSDRRLEKTA
jgi:hypothetical protein